MCYYYLLLLLLLPVLDSSVPCDDYGSCSLCVSHPCDYFGREGTGEGLCVPAGTEPEEIIISFAVLWPDRNCSRHVPPTPTPIPHDLPVGTRALVPVLVSVLSVIVIFSVVGFIVNRHRRPPPGYSRMDVEEVGEIIGMNVLSPPAAALEEEDEVDEFISPVLREAARVVDTTPYITRAGRVSRPPRRLQF